MGTKHSFAAIAAGILLSSQGWTADSTSSAFGARLDLNANVQIIGLGVGAAALARTPFVQGNGSTSYGPFSQTVLGTQVGLLGTTVLNAGVLTASTEHNSITPLTTSRGGTENAVVNLQITPLLPLVGVTADSIYANARVSGTCGNLSATGDAHLVNARVTALGGGLINLPVDPPPNFTVGLGALGVVGVTLVLNEQIVTNTPTQASIIVNALHLDVSANVLLASLVGDIVIGNAQAQRSCAAGDGPNLLGSKSATPSPATVGLPVQFNLSAENVGNQTANNVVLSDTVNAAFSIQSATAGPGGNCNVAGQLVTCSFGSLAPGATVSATIISIPTQVGSFSNTLTTGHQGPDPGPPDDPTIIIPVDPPAAVSDLSVVKTASPNPGTVGQPLTFTLAVSNAGPDASGASVTDVLAASLTFQSATASDGGNCTGTSTVVCNWASIPSGATRTATIVAVPTQAGTLSNSAAVTSTTGSSDPDPGDDMSTIDIPINPAGTVADLSVVKTATPNPATVGQPLTFTLAVNNAGPDAAGASVTDTLAASLTFQSASASNGGSCTGTVTVVCSWASIPSGATRTATIVTVPTLAGTLSNSAAVTSTTGSSDPDPGDDVSTIDVPVNPAVVVADLSMLKTANPNPVTVGQPLTYTLTVSNAGPDAAGANATDVLPAGATLQSVSASGGGSCSGSGTISCSWASIAAGQSRTATIVVVPTQAGLLSNTAVVAPTGGATDPDNGDDTSTVEVTVVPAIGSADLGVQMTANPNPVTVAANLAYTLSISNAGPDAAAARVTDVLPPSMTLQSAIADNGGNCSGTTTVTCTWSAIPSGGNRSVVITVRPTQAGAISNSASVASTDGSLDPNPANNSASIQVQVDSNQQPPSADLSVVATASPQPAIVGEPFTLSLTVSNAGPDAASAVLGDLLDSSFSVQGVNASNGGNCTTSNALSCSWTQIPANGSVSALVIVLPTSAGSFGNTATVSVPVGVTDPNPGNNSTTITLVVNNAVSPTPRADLAAVVRALPDTIGLGQLLVLEIQVSNAGPDAAGVTLTQTLDSGFLFDEITAPGWSCTGSTLISCSLASLANGGTSTLQLTVRTTRTGTITHLASVSPVSPAIDPNLTNNIGSAIVSISGLNELGNTDLSLSKVAIPSDPVVGSTVNYVLTISNLGPAPAAGPIVLVDQLPTSLTALSVTAQSGGICTLSANVVTCTWDGIDSGLLVSASVLATANVVGMVRNVATVTHPNNDSDPSNDTAQTDVDVRPADLIASDGAQCRVTRKITEHSAAQFSAIAEMRYGGADVIFADQITASAGTFSASLLADSQKAALMERTGSDAQLLGASRNSAVAVVRSSKNLVDGSAADAPAAYLLDTRTQAARRLPDEVNSSLQLAVSGSGDEVFYLAAVGTNEVVLKSLTVANGSVSSLRSFSASAAQFGEMKLSESGRVVAFTSRINPSGENNDGSMEVFRFAADSGVLTQVTAGVNGSQSLGGFDGAGDRLAWIAAGQIVVHDPVRGSRQLTGDATTKRSALLTHNGKKVMYLATAGDTAGSLELVSVDVDSGAAPKVLTRINKPGSDDRLLSHDGSGQTLLLASSRALLNDADNGLEHVYMIDCDAVRSGAWYNPQRSGHGFAIQRSQDGLAVLWYTYRADGTPTWYIASGPRQGKSWKAELLDVRYNYTDDSRTLTPVGTLALNFADSHNAVVQWTLNGVTRFERIEFLEFAADAPVRDDTGVWFDPNNPGWGLSISHQGKTRFMLAYLYDSAGQPLWVEGQTENNALSTPGRLYFGPGLCGTTCGESAPLPINSNIGSFSVNVRGFGDLIISTNYLRDGSQPIDWLRASRPFVPLTPLNP